MILLVKNMEGNMEEPKFIINTVMTKEDYRKFLYIAAFKRNRMTILFLSLIALLGSIIISLNYTHSNFAVFIINWIFLFALAIIAVIFKIERKYAQRIKTDKTDAFDSVNILKFYNDRIYNENKELTSESNCLLPFMHYKQL